MASAVIHADVQRTLGMTGDLRSTVLSLTQQLERMTEANRELGDRCDALERARNRTRTESTAMATDAQRLFAKNQKDLEALVRALLQALDDSGGGGGGGVVVGGGGVVARGCGCGCARGGGLVVVLSMFFASAAAFENSFSLLLSFCWVARRSSLTSLPPLPWACSCPLPVCA